MFHNCRASAINLHHITNTYSHHMTNTYVHHITNTYSLDICNPNTLVHPIVYCIRSVIQSHSISFNLILQTQSNCMYYVLVLGASFNLIQSHSISFNLILQSQSNWSRCNGTWPKGRTELDHRLSLEISEMILQMQ